MKHSFSRIKRVGNLYIVYLCQHGHTCLPINGLSAHKIQIQPAIRATQYQQQNSFKIIVKQPQSQLYPFFQDKKNLLQHSKYLADRYRSKWPMLLNTSGARCIPTFMTEFPAAAMQQRVQIQRLPTRGSNSADFISSQLERFYPFFQDKKFSLILRLKSVQTGQKTMMWRRYVANYGYSDGQYFQSNPLGHSLCAVEGVWSRISQCNRRQRKNIISFFLSFFLGGLRLTEVSQLVRVLQHQ